MKKNYKVLCFDKEELDLLKSLGIRIKKKESLGLNLYKVALKEEDINLLQLAHPEVILMYNEF